LRNSRLSIPDNQVSETILRVVDHQLATGEHDRLYQWRQNLRAERAKTEPLTTQDIKKGWTINWERYGRYLEAKLI
jgi:hypothetical protein